MSQICSCCGNKLKNSDHYEVISRNARDHDKEERIEDLKNEEKKKEEEANEEKIRKIEEEKKKKIEAYKADLRDLDDDELDELLESLRAEIHELKNQLKPKTDEEKKEKKASLEYLGVDSPAYKTKNYSVLALEPYHDNKLSGDALLIRLGSTGDKARGNSKDDELLKSIGSRD